MRKNILFFGTSILFSLTTTAKENRKPNIILIVADDMGYGDIGCYGNTKTLTPNLDRMAKNGVKFLDFHSNGAVSSPTRAALLTGKYQQRVGIPDVLTAKNDREEGLALSEITIAEELKNAGYATGIFGKWHLGYSSEFNPINQGFNDFKGYVSGNVDYISHVDQEGNPDWWNGKKIENEQGYSTDLIANNSIDFILKNRKQPFFLYIAHEAPHYPYQIRESEGFRVAKSTNAEKTLVYGNEKDIPSVYKKMVEILDENVGKIFTTLKDVNIDENTIVIFLSDNGGTKHGNNGVLRGFKGSVYEGGHRVPAIVQWPGHIKPATCNETVLTMDVYPTLLEIAGIKKRNTIDGKSFAKLLTKQEQLNPRTLFWQYKKQYAVRKANWKLVLDAKDSIPKLFDLTADIAEVSDIADQNPETVNKLMNELEKWKSEVFKSNEILKITR